MEGLCMGSAEGGNSLIHFGPFELDPDAEQLRKRGVVLKLQPQQFVVLLMLAQRAGEIVTRQEIQQHVWGDGTFVDFDRAINYCINQIRSTLSDDAERPRSIETIPRRGYRFIAPVEVRRLPGLPSREPPGPPARATPAKSDFAEQPANLGPRAWPRVAVVAGFILLLGAALLQYGGWQSRRSSSSESRSLVRAGIGDAGQSAGSRVLAPAVMPLTSNPGNEIQPGFSPDGNQVVYAFNEGGAGPYHIYVKALGSEQTVRLTSASSDDVSPAWSPDGESIAFIRLGSEGGASVMIVPSSGGNVRKLASIAIDLLHQSDTRVSWSPDGDWIATSEVNSAGTSRLILISARSGQKKNLNYDPPKFESPDGKQVFYTKTTEPGLWMLSLENGDESKILPNTVGFECFTMGKRGIYFERKAERFGFMISYMSLSDHVVRDVATIRAPVGDGLSVSPGERSILITQIDHAGSDLFLVENFK
jgi:DNA-binding winged helix-turn-helix (wHTH) protein